MIIQYAYEALEVKKSNKPDITCRWDYLSLKIGDNIFRMVFEMNSAYCRYLLRQWMINDKIETDVRDKYDGGFVKFDCSNDRLGVRPFEFDISYEYCLKLMGIPLGDIKNREHNWSLSGYELKEILKKNNIPFEIIFEGVY